MPRFNIGDTIFIAKFDGATSVEPIIGSAKIIGRSPTKYRLEKSSHFTDYRTMVTQFEADNNWGGSKMQALQLLHHRKSTERVGLQNKIGNIGEQIKAIEEVMVSEGDNNG